MDYNLHPPDDNIRFGISRSVCLQEDEVYQQVHYCFDMPYFLRGIDRFNKVAPFLYYDLRYKRYNSNSTKREGRLISYLFRGVHLNGSSYQLTYLDILSSHNPIYGQS